MSLQIQRGKPLLFTRPEHLEKKENIEQGDRLTDRLYQFKEIQCAMYNSFNHDERIFFFSGNWQRVRSSPEESESLQSSFGSPRSTAKRGGRGDEDHVTYSNKHFSCSKL